MLKKFSIVLSVVASLGFAAAAPAEAKEPQKNVQVKKNFQVKKYFQVKKNVQVKKNIVVNKNFNNKKFVVGKKYNGHVWFGHSRHRWHGRWYAYGEGPCWINVEGEWFWNVVACPF